MSKSEGAARPQFSADGEWWWTGREWVPAAEAPNLTATTQDVESIEAAVEDPITQPNSGRESSYRSAIEGQAPPETDETPPYITGHNGLVVSLGGDWWWNGSKWHGFDKRPAEVQPSARGPKLGFKEAMATPALAKQYRLSPGGYPMHPLGKKESTQLAQSLLAGKRCLANAWVCQVSHWLSRIRKS